MLLAVLVYFTVEKDGWSGRQGRPMEKKPEKGERRKGESTCVRGWSSHIVDHKLVMPPSMPMVF